jgi:hypothetical protein
MPRLARYPLGLCLALGACAAVAVASGTWVRLTTATELATLTSVANRTHACGFDRRHNHLRAGSITNQPTGDRIDRWARATFGGPPLQACVIVFSRSAPLPSLPHGTWGAVTWGSAPCEPHSRVPRSVCRDLRL